MSSVTIAQAIKVIQEIRLEATQAASRIKQWADDVSLLTLVLKSINNAPPGAIDWSKNLEMQKMLKTVKGMGAELPEECYFTEEERNRFENDVYARSKDIIDRIDLTREHVNGCNKICTNLYEALSKFMKVSQHE